MADGAGCRSSCRRLRSCVCLRPKPQRFAVEHDLLRKPVPTFRDHARMLAPTSRSRMTAFDAVLYAGLVLSWGFSWLAVHYQIGVVAPEVSLVWRFALAAPMMFAV